MTTFYNSILKQFLRGFIFFTLVVSCSSSSDQDCEEGLITYPTPEQILSGDQYRQSLEECRVPKIQTYQVSNITGGEVIANQGTAFSVNPQTFLDQNGNFIDGDVTFEILEMFTQGDIIACQLSTNGVNPENNIEPLLTEGLFYLNITYNNQPVTIIQNIDVFIPSSNLGNFNYMFLSPSCPNLLCQVLWERDDTVEVIEEPYITNSGIVIDGYKSHINQNGMGWHNIGRYLPQNTNRTTLYNKTPSGYNKTNSNVFLIFNQNALAISLFEKYDDDSKFFTEFHSQLPKDFEAQLIFITKQSQEFLYASKPVTITENKITTTLEINSEQEEETLINALNDL